MSSKKRGRRRAPHGGNDSDSGGRTTLEMMELPTNGISTDIFANEDSVRAVPRADTLKGKQLEEFGIKYRLVCLVNNGRSPRQALEHLRPEHPMLNKRTERWAQQLVQNYKKHGVAALLDHRSNRTNEARVLTSVVKRITLCWFVARPAACYSLIAKIVAIECNKRGIPAPPGRIGKHKYYGSISLLDPESSPLPDAVSRRRQVLGIVYRAVEHFGRAVRNGDVLDFVAGLQEEVKINPELITRDLLNLSRTGELTVVGTVRGDEKGVNLYLPSDLDPDSFTRHSSLLYSKSD